MKKRNILFQLPLILLILLFSCSSDDSSDGAPSLSSNNLITSFELVKGSFSTSFTISENAINGTVSEFFELTDILLEVSISNGASISPDPSTITSISGPFNLTVTAENGDTRQYTINITNELNDENFILSYTFTTPDFVTTSYLDPNTTTIIKRFPTFTDKTNLDLAIVYSEQATISPDPASITNYSSDIDFVITALNGEQRIYTLKVETMDIDLNNVCEETNANKWFGGDDRTNTPSGLMPFDRNVGTGQGVVFEEDVHPTKFGLRFTEAFKYYENGSTYNNPLDIKLNIRQQDGTLIGGLTQTIPANFNGGWIEFNITNFKLFFDKDIEYIFTMHVINGESIGVNTGSYGSTIDGNGFCYAQAYTGQSKLSESTSLEDWNTWSEHPWHFNMRIEGKK
ncbi:hypothetical protein [Kordia sp.]|uniref:hypothetical protein n=1 Tax=Kordia sp. TaxID=1965332 RepID=UPI003D2BA144